MRRLTDAARMGELMRALGAEARERARLYFTGGATAVLVGWRETTIDVDLRIAPESDSLLRAIPRLKEELQINIELASPADFIPEIPGWEDRSLYIAKEGPLTFYHYDFYAQAWPRLSEATARMSKMSGRCLPEDWWSPRRSGAASTKSNRFSTVTPPFIRPRSDEPWKQW